MPMLFSRFFSSGVIQKLSAAKSGWITKRVLGVFNSTPATDKVDVYRGYDLPSTDVVAGLLMLSYGDSGDNNEAAFHTLNMY